MKQLLARDDQQYPQMGSALPEVPTVEDSYQVSMSMPITT